MKASLKDPPAAWQRAKMQETEVDDSHAVASHDDFPVFNLGLSSITLNPDHDAVTRAEPERRLFASMER